MQIDLTQLRPGNIIVVYPRENQKGILFILEIQKSSILCEMLVPRKGYLFRIQFPEVHAQILNEEWLKRASFIQDPVTTANWFCKNKKTLFQFASSCGTFSEASKRQINYVHELQNEYFELTREELTVTID